jgi:hypothetical protein
MGLDSDHSIDAQVAEWRSYIRRHRELSTADADELEDHLRDRIADLTAAGLEPDEAFLVAVKRIGGLDALTREFAREHSERLWKQLVLTGEPDSAAPSVVRRDLVVMIGCALVAAVAVKLPALFGADLEDDAAFYARNASLFALVPLAAYFSWRRAVRPGVVGVLAALFALGALGADAYPLGDDAPATLLTAVHLPMALWLVMGVAYVGGDWRTGSRRMDFVRFTGEWFIYYVLIALGGGVLVGLTIAVLQPAGIEPDTIAAWVLPTGAAGAVIVAAWLVESKQRVIENMAPVLTMLFTPMFALMLAVAAVAYAVSGLGDAFDRELLGVFDALLVVVLGLVLYGISAREDAPTAGWMDRIQVFAVGCALVLDAMVLVSMISRIGDVGWTPNRAAALGLNLVLLVNLAVSGWWSLRFLTGRASFHRLERWQTAYLPVFAAWAAVVVVVFPPAFAFS